MSISLTLSLSRSSTGFVSVHGSVLDSTLSVCIDGLEMGPDKESNVYFGFTRRPVFGRKAKEGHASFPQIPPGQVRM